MEMLLGIISFNKKLYYRQTKSTKDAEKVPRQMFLAEKRKKTKNKKRKTDLLKSLKRKRLTKTEKKGWFPPKAQDWRAAIWESHKNHKIQINPKTKPNKYANKNPQKKITENKNSKEERTIIILKEMISYMFRIIEYVSFIHIMTSLA